MDGPWLHFEKHRAGSTPAVGTSRGRNVVLWEAVGRGCLGPAWERKWPPWGHVLGPGLRVSVSPSAGCRAGLGGPLL